MAADCGFRRWNRLRAQALGPAGRPTDYLRRRCPRGIEKGEFKMLISALVTFLVVILILYLINMLPIDGRAKQIARIVVIVLGVISLLKYIAVF
jgi:hypothetical protein